MAASEINEKENKLAYLGVPFLGKIGFDGGYESSLGNVGRLLKTQFAGDLRKIINNSLDAD